MDSRQGQPHRGTSSERETGLGTAYVKGFKYALEQGYDLVFEMDADAHRPEHLPEFLAAIEDADLVLGCRYMEEAEQRTGDGLGGCCLAEELVCPHAPDSSVQGLDGRVHAFAGRFWRPSIWIQWSPRLCFSVELTCRTHSGIPHQESNRFPDRTLGHSKMDRKIVVEALVRLWGFASTVRAKGPFRLIVREISKAFSGGCVGCGCIRRGEAGRRRFVCSGMTPSLRLSFGIYRVGMSRFRLLDRLSIVLLLHPFSSETVLSSMTSPSIASPSCSDRSGM